MFITPSFKKSLIVEQFQGNYLKFFSKQSVSQSVSQSLELVTIVIEINVVIDGYSGEGLKWLAHVTLRLQVAYYSQLSDYNFAD